ncbi:MAG: glycosyltransferase family 4 protein [Candidatus Aquicultorales bacterium]
MLEKTERPLRVLLATVFEYPHAGGLSTHMATLGRALERRGHVVETISISNYPRWLYFLLIKLPSYVLNKTAKGWGLVWSHQMRKVLLRGLYAVRRGRKRFDVVNAEDFFAVNALTGRGRETLPVVLTVHGLWRFESMSVGSLVEGTVPDRYIRDEELRALARSARIVTVEEGRKEYLLGLGADPGKVSVVSNFIEPRLFEESFDHARVAAEWGVPEGALTILCPCRLARVKGVDVAIEAMADVRGERPEAVLLVAGIGELRAELEEKTERLGLSGNVRFLGSVPADRMRELYALSDIVAIPSRRDEKAEEGVSVAALEAMASAKPLVVTPVGGFKSLVRDGENGLVVPDENPRALAEAILRLGNDGDLAGSLGEQERNYVNTSHDADLAARIFEDIYRSAMDR